MRKITKDAQNAINNFESFSSDNTMVQITDSGIANLLLHGHLIASKRPNGQIAFSMCGWGTPTTRERLGAVEVSIGQRKGEQYYINSITKEETLISTDSIYIINDDETITKA